MANTSYRAHRGENVVALREPQGPQRSSASTMIAALSDALAERDRELEACREKLARLQEELASRERLSALGELAAVVANEVRSPLYVLTTSIRGLGDYVRGGSLPVKAADAATFAAMAEEEAAHLTRIVSDLLDFAQPHPPSLRVGPLAPVFDEVAAATAADGRVRFTIADDLPTVHLDPQFMRQAVLNLVLSGLTAIGKDGTLTVCAAVDRDDEGTVRIDVVDDGPGIPADVRGSIFAPFFSTRQAGTGLGLAVVKRIVDAHGGTLAVESGPRGTRFTIRVPACASAS